MDSPQPSPSQTPHHAPASAEPDLERAFTAAGGEAPPPPAAAIDEQTDRIVTATGTSSSPTAAERARDVMQRLKPAATAAETATARAVNLSARALTKLGAYLDERQRRRTTAQPPDDVPLDTP